MKKHNNYNNVSILVNKENILPLNYIPSKLKKLSKKYSHNDQYLKKCAQENFEKMAKDIEKQNMKIIAVSSYRNSQYQNKLFRNYVKEKGIEYAKKCCAEAGKSEHQTGLAVDISDTSLDYDNFDRTKEFIWVKDNCYKYGFILRYPKNKTDITGYKYEPWHYRYVGCIAAYIHLNKLTLEECKEKTTIN